MFLKKARNAPGLPAKGEKRAGVARTRFAHVIAFTPSCQSRRAERGGKRRGCGEAASLSFALHQEVENRFRPVSFPARPRPGREESGALRLHARQTSRPGGGQAHAIRRFPTAPQEAFLFNEKNIRPFSFHHPFPLPCPVKLPQRKNTQHSAECGGIFRFTLFFSCVLSRFIVISRKLGYISQSIYRS